MKMLKFLGGAVVLTLAAIGAIYILNDTSFEQPTMYRNALS